MLAALHLILFASLLAAATASSAPHPERAVLGDGVKRFHTTTLGVKQNHRRERRATTANDEPALAIDVDVFGEATLTLALWPSRSIFATDVRFESHSSKDGIREIAIDIGRFHKGHVQGVPGSSVHGYYDPETTTLDGVVTLPATWHDRDGSSSKEAFSDPSQSNGDDYTHHHHHNNNNNNNNNNVEPSRFLHVERASRYHLGPHHASTNHTSVVYWRSDVHVNDTTICGEETHRRMLSKQRRIDDVVRPQDKGQDKSQDNDSNSRDSPHHQRATRPRPGGTPFNDAQRRNVHRRSELDGDEPTPPSNEACTEYCTCTVALLADQYFFRGPLGNNDRSTTVAQMVTFLTDVDSIYRATTFLDQTGFGYQITDVLVYEDASMSGNPVPGSSYTADSYLETLSNFKDWSAYCLIHMFTHRDFEDGILGLAWVGSAGGAGGVCDDRGLNSGFTTSLNYGSTVNSAVSMVTLAHEFGHNWGSPHDSTSECAPGAPDGNYIMYAMATDGSRPFNTRFSPCSQASISSTLASKRKSCFAPPTETLCGNGIVEGDELCDCGHDCDNDPCCLPECKLALDAECSPQDPLRDPCCTETCQFVPASAQKTCTFETDCGEASMCSGNFSTCPAPEAKPLGTLCDCQEANCTLYPTTATRVCDAGSCSGSICSLYNDTTECRLLGARACQLACRGPGWGNGTQCVSTSDTTKQRPENVYGVKLVAGTPCENYEGYCDTGGKCKTVDSNDLLDKLEDYLNFSPADAWRWVKGNWPYFVGALGGCVLLFVALRITYPKKKGGRRGGYDILDDDDDDGYVMASSHAPSRAATPWGKGTPWLLSSLSKADAECVLKSANTEGAFLVRRDPRSKEDHILSMSCGNKIWHHTIVYDATRDKFYLQFSPTLKFDTLSQLITHFAIEAEGILPCRLSHAVGFGDLRGQSALHPA